MLNRYPIYSVCAILAIGSLSASDFDLALRRQEKFTILNHQKNTEENDSKAAAPMLILQPCPDAWRFSADFLYFMPTVDDTYFAMDSPIPGTFTLKGTRRNNNFGFSPGFRVGAEYAFCETHRDIQVFYTYLHAEEHETIFGENLWPTVGSSSFASAFSEYDGSASSKLKLLYQRLDFNVSQHIIDAHGFNLYVQPGFEYAYLRLQQSYKFVPPDVIPGTVYQQSRGWGIGPQLGLGFDANLCQGSSGSNRSITHAITISSLFSSSLLTGQGKTWELDARVGGTTNDSRDDQAWRVIPAIHARVGLAYLVHGSSAGASLSVGYEFNTYIRGIAKTIFPSSITTSNILTNYYNFDIQGLDVSLAVSF